MKPLWLGLLLLAACSGNSPEANLVRAEESEPAPSNEVQPPAEPSLWGMADGLEFGGRSVKFGAPLTEAVKLAEAAGGQSGPLQLLEECSAGPLVAGKIGNLSLLGEGERFVGWHISENGPLTLRMDKGVMIGTAKSELQRAHPVELFESSIGTEFYSSDGWGGLLEDSSPTAKVAHLWAGTTCIMR